MTENLQDFLSSSRTQKGLAIMLILAGLFQATSSLAQDSLKWALFYSLTGIITALCGAGFLRTEIKSSEQ